MSRIEERGEAGRTLHQEKETEGLDACAKYKKDYFCGRENVPEILGFPTTEPAECIQWWWPQLRLGVVAECERKGRRDNDRHAQFAEHPVESS